MLNSKSGRNAANPSTNMRLLNNLALVAALGGLLFGYDTAVISGAVDAIDFNFITPRHLSDALASTLSGTAVSIALLGCMIGALIAGPISTRFGRKGGLLLAAIFFSISSAGAAFPELGGIFPGASALAPFMVFRIIGGLGIGVASMLSPLYIAEIAPAHVRGRMVTYQQIAIVLGITLVYFVNYLIALQGGPHWVLSMGWRYMLLSGIIPAGLFFLLLLRVPDTPRWLVLSGRDDDARAVLTRLTNRDAADVTVREIQATLIEKTRPVFTYGKLILIIGLLLSIFQQFVGINAVLYYAPLMFENAGASGDSAFLQTILVGVVMTVFTLAATASVDKLGRKPLLITGACIMAVSMLALGYVFQAQVGGAWALIIVSIYIAGFSLSWGPVVWVMLAEIFPNSIKGKAMALAVAAQWIANFLVSQTFKMMNDNGALTATFHHGFAYYFYGACGLIAALFVWKFVPETMGRTLEQMDELWGDKKPPLPVEATD